MVIARQQKHYCGQGSAETLEQRYKFYDFSTKRCRDTCTWNVTNVCKVNIRKFLGICILRDYITLVKCYFSGWQNTPTYGGSTWSQTSSWSSHFFWGLCKQYWYGKLMWFLKDFDVTVYLVWIFRGSKFLRPIWFWLITLIQNIVL